MHFFPNIFYFNENVSILWIYFYTHILTIGYQVKQIKDLSHFTHFTPEI